LSHTIKVWQIYKSLFKICSFNIVTKFVLAFSSSMVCSLNFSYPLSSTHTGIQEFMMNEIIGDAIND